MSTKNNEPLVLAPKKKKAGDVTSNIHNALETSGVLNIAEDIENAAPGFDVVKDVLKSPENHDPEINAAVATAGIFNPMGLINSLSSTATQFMGDVADYVGDIPGKSFQAVGKMIAGGITDRDQSELNAMMPENLQFLIKDIFRKGDAADMGVFTEKYTSPEMLDAVARAYFQSRRRLANDPRYVSGKWKDNTNPGIVYGDWAHGSPEGLSRYENMDYLGSKWLGSAQVIENDDGTITVNDTFDFNDSEWSEAGLTRWHYDTDGNIDYGKYDAATGKHVYKEGSKRKSNPYGAKPVSEMTDTEKLFSALNEIKDLDLTGGNIQPAFRTLAFYFGSKDSSGRPISLTFNPHEAIQRKFGAITKKSDPSRRFKSYEEDWEKEKLGTKSPTWGGMMEWEAERMGKSTEGFLTREEWMRNSKTRGTLFSDQGAYLETPYDLVTGDAANRIWRKKKFATVEKGKDFLKNPSFMGGVNLLRGLMN